MISYTTYQNNAITTTKLNEWLKQKLNKKTLVLKFYYQNTPCTLFHR